MCGADRVIKIPGLRTHVSKKKGEKGRTRIENFQEELVTATRQFSYNDEDERFNAILRAFLSRAALEAAERGRADTRRRMRYS